VDQIFAKRKLALQNEVLKKIQQAEKANQQESRQTEAYKSSGKTQELVEQNDKQNQLLEEEMKEEQMLNRKNSTAEDDDDEARAFRQHQKASFIQANFDTTLNQGTSRALELKHARCTIFLNFNKFDWSEQDLNRFHRPDMNRHLGALLY